MAIEPKLPPQTFLTPRLMLFGSPRLSVSEAPYAEGTPSPPLRTAGRAPVVRLRRPQALLQTPPSTLPMPARKSGTCELFPQSESLPRT